MAKDRRTIRIAKLKRKKLNREFKEQYNKMFMSKSGKN
jgi:hypothetical protein